MTVPWLLLNKHSGTSFKTLLIQYESTLLKIQTYHRKSCYYFEFSENFISVKNVITGCQIGILFSPGPGDPIKRFYAQVHQQKILCVVQEIQNKLEKKT